MRFSPRMSWPRFPGSSPIRPLLIACGIAWMIAAGSAAEKPALTETQDAPLSREHLDFFEAKIRPLLAARCYECHSVTAKKLKANLRVDTRDGLLQGGDLGPA